MTDQLEFSVVLLIGFMVFGLAIRRLRYPLGGLLMAFVLGQTLETQLYLTGQLNSYGGFGFVTHRPIADVMVVLAVVVVIAKWREMRKEAAERKADLAKDLAAHDGSVPIELRRIQLLNPYPLLAVIVDVGLAALSIYVIAYAVLKFDAATGLLPLIAAAAILLPVLVYLPRDVSRYITLKEGKRGRVDRRCHRSGGWRVLEPGADRARSGSAFYESCGAFMGIARAIPPRSRIDPVVLALMGLSFVFGFEGGGAILMVAYGLVSTKEYFKTRFAHLTFVALSTVVMVGLLYLMFYVTSIPDRALIHF